MPRDVQVAAIGPSGETGDAHVDISKPATDRGARRISPCRWKCATRPRGLRFSGEDSAGAVQLLDTGGIGAARWDWCRRRRPRMNSRFCRMSIIWSARWRLSPKCEKGTISELIAQHVSVLFLADIGKIGGSDADAVEKFVKGGGVLVRFAGPRMTGGTDALVPVTLRVGGRYLGSAMAWDQPQHLARFPADLALSTAWPCPPK